MKSQFKPILKFLQERQIKAFGRYNYEQCLKSVEIFSILADIANGIGNHRLYGRVYNYSEGVTVIMSIKEAQNFFKMPLDELLSYTRPLVRIICIGTSTGEDKIDIFFRVNPKEFLPVEPEEKKVIKPVIRKKAKKHHKLLIHRSLNTIYGPVGLYTWARQRRNSHFIWHFAMFHVNLYSEKYDYENRTSSLYIYYCSHNPVDGVLEVRRPRAGPRLSRF